MFSFPPSFSAASPPTRRNCGAAAASHLWYRRKSWPHSSLPVVVCNLFIKRRCRSLCSLGVTFVCLPKIACSAFLAFLDLRAPGRYIGARESEVCHDHGPAWVRAMAPRAVSPGAAYSDSLPPQTPHRPGSPGLPRLHCPQRIFRTIASRPIRIINLSENLAPFLEDTPLVHRHVEPLTRPDGEILPPPQQPTPLPEVVPGTTRAADCLVQHHQDVGIREPRHRIPIALLG